MRNLLFMFLCSYALAQQGVGIGTTNPQQDLHLASTTGTLRVESLNSINNEFNGGDVNGDMDLTNDTFAVYVDEDGNFTLELKTLYNSEELDELDGSMLPNSSVVLNNADTDGIETTEITSYSITVARASILEVKYNLSFDVYEDNAKTILSDNLARRISTYINITGQTREYGPATKCYSSGSVNSTGQTLYNTCTAYISIPAAGTYDLKLIGAVSSDIRSGGGPGGPSLDTYVEFATGNDSILLRVL